MRLNSTLLRKLILETVEEIQNESKNKRNNELKEIAAKAKLLLAEEAKAEDVDSKRFPMKLSDAAASAGPEAELKVTGGGDDGEIEEDKVKAKKGSIACKDAKPSQSSMNVQKAMCFALAAIQQVKPFENGPGGDLGAIITSDNHIMDGHHRWIASGMVNPNAQLGGYVVEFPAKQMIAALNMITVKLGITQGKSGTGGFDQFNEPGFLAVLKDFAANGAYFMKKGSRIDWDTLPSEKVLEMCESFTGEKGDAAISAAAKKFAGNVSTLTLSVPGDFPTRDDMPVISPGKGHLDMAIELLRKGQVDLNEPYAESKKSNDQLIVERWNKLAGF
tara:strand:+ start:298 stop:1293 length:996 start_codon:yes stop_codon:yes gene_type:complete